MPAAVHVRRYDFEVQAHAHIAGPTGSSPACTAAPISSGRRCRACGRDDLPLAAFPPLRYREDGTVRQPTECRSCLAARERARRGARANDNAALRAALVAAVAAKE
jgi:hypothetical protein